METYGKTATASESLRGELVSMTRKRWNYVTDCIRPQLYQSQRAWEAYLDNEISRDAKLAAKTEHSILKNPRMGYIPKTVNTLLSLQHNASFTSEKTFFSGTPLNELASELKPLYEKSLENRAQQKNILQSLRMLRLCTILDGTACLYVKHSREVNTRVVYEPEQVVTLDAMTGQPVPQATGNVTETKLKEIVYDGGEVEIIPFADWRIEPFAKNVDEAYFIRRSWVDIYKAKQMFPEAPKELFVPLSERYDNEYVEMNNERYSNLNGRMHELDTACQEAKEQCLITFHYDDFYVDGKLYENHVAVVINDMECIWFGENPYNHGKKPYLIGQYFEIPHQLYGLSAVYHILPSSELLDKSFSTLIENADWGSSPVFTGRMNDPFVASQKNKKIEKGTIIPTLYPDSIAQLPIDLSNLQYMLNMMAMADQNIKDVSGATDYMTGAEANKTHISATDTMSRIDNGSSRFQTILDTFNRNFTQPLVQMLYENDRQYKVTDEYVDGGVITPEEIKLCEFRFDIVSAKAVATKTRTATQLLQVLQQLAPMLMQMGLLSPKMQVTEMDTGALLNDLFYNMDLTNSDKYIQSRELTPEEQQMMQMAQMLQQMPQEGDEQSGQTE